ncbi:hypothetical protein [Natrinema versiforme]|uniref:Transporter n=1 Tax=Natrinema versiforme JCM 10478 TaxID=1227496 RepID=L9XW52_9EURY|nr:hypothetical protein [Natrinema versiforme]ELY65747.1 hypothetical protein C489_14295 [Natrinema versiforme JCM 10478]
MTAPYRDHVQQPTESALEDAAETRWGIREGIGLSLVSIFGLLLLVIGLMLAPGLIAAASTVAITLGLVLFAVALVAVGHWSWNGR